MASEGISTQANCLPGFGKRHDFMPTKAFPAALNAKWAKPTFLRLLTLRERAMEAFMNSITDKPGWQNKIVNNDITSKWRQEALDRYNIMTPRMVDWCIAEVAHEKLRDLEESAIVPVFSLGVFKSDVVVGDDLRRNLMEQVLPLENVPRPDWHPGSNGQVLDLVHPSLYPLVYGRSKVLKQGRTTLRDCIQQCGEGVRLPKIEPEKEERRRRRVSFSPWSERYQWLPCEVEVGAGRARITSYINNLHPHRHQALYSTVEQIIVRVIPMWNRSLSAAEATHIARRRIDDFVYEYEFNRLEEKAVDENDREWYKPSVRETEGMYFDYIDDEPNRRTIVPEPDTYRTLSQRMDGSDERLAAATSLPYGFVDLEHKGQLQIIVKLANIILTPEQPSYPGGSWHVEGQLNEHICASALYYYDSENITESRLAFRGLMEEPDSANSSNDKEDYAQNQHLAPEDIYGFKNGQTQVLSIGDVATNEGRVITFPNTLQHQVQPFSLQNPAKPGHRKILALFLVDPNIPIISTAHVPCQRADWWLEVVRDNPGLNKLPNEMVYGVLAQIHDFPITDVEAKKIREELMEERKVFDADNTTVLTDCVFSLCEH